MGATSDDGLEARLRAASLSAPGCGLDDALRRGKAARARQEWVGLARLAAAAAVVWLLSVAVGAAVDRSIGVIHGVGRGVVVAAGESGKPSPCGVLSIVWRRRQVEEMALEDWGCDWQPQGDTPVRPERDGRRGSVEPVGPRRMGWREGGRAYV